MNNSTRFLFGTVFAGIMGLTALVPSGYAQDLGAPKDAPPIAQPDDKGGLRPDGGPRGERPGERGGIAGMICSTDGATQLETRLTDLATQLKLTTDQQPLFDAYQTAALSAQTSFADTCPQPPAAGTEPVPPDALTAMKDRVTHQTAELAALNAVLPSFEAFYNSLTDTQKADLMPLVGPHHGPRGPGDDHGSDRTGRHDARGNDNGRGGEPGRGGDKGRHG